MFGVVVVDDHAGYLSISQRQQRLADRIEINQIAVRDAGDLFGRPVARQRVGQYADGHARRNVAMAGDLLLIGQYDQHLAHFQVGIAVSNTRHRVWPG